MLFSRSFSQSKAVRTAVITLLLLNEYYLLSMNLPPIFLSLLATTTSVLLCT